LAAWQRAGMADQQKPGYRALRRGRYSQPGGIYFVTTVTKQRIPWFQVFEFARLLCRELEHPDGVLDAQNLCWVVMPDHLHLLLQLENEPLGRVMNRLKSRTAVILNREIGRSGSFWEPGFHDHALRREEDMRGIARYIVANPLRAGLVTKIGDYPFWNARWL
jgi:REP element-mobilizing transposase RayT